MRYNTSYFMIIIQDLFQAQHQVLPAQSDELSHWSVQAARTPYELNNFVCVVCKINACVHVQINNTLEFCVRVSYSHTHYATTHSYK